MSRPKKNLKFGANASTNKKPGAGGKDEKAKGGERKKGFQVGPAHAPRNAYLGKAKKIKDDLIMKSKLKREYAKVLKEEGAQSTRLKSKTKSGQASSDATAQAMVDETSAGANEDRSENATAPERRGSLKRKQSDRSDKRPEREGREDRRQKTERSTKRPRSDTRDRNDQPRKVRALSPGDIGPPMPQSSLRDLKKEAFQKYHPARPAPSAVKAGLRNVSGASDTARNSAGGFGGSLARVFSGASTGGRGGRRGQPNMAARMGALLEQIKHDRR